MKISLDTRLTLAFFVGVAGLIWQGVIVTLGGVPSEALLTAFTTITLATIGIGGLKSNGNQSEEKQTKDE